jgi:DnaJ-class molecular chaperone
LDLKEDRKQECGPCNGTGVTRLPLDYPCLEVEQFCQDCETGRLLAAQMAEIVALTLRRGRIKAA